MKSSTQPLSPLVRDDIAAPAAWSSWAKPAPSTFRPIEVIALGEPEVATETCCAYCRREGQALVTCIQCQRNLCGGCRKGLCAKSQCMPRPQGDGVR